MTEQDVLNRTNQRVDFINKFNLQDILKDKITTNKMKNLFIKIGFKWFGVADSDMFLDATGYIIEGNHNSELNEMEYTFLKL